MSKLNYFNYLLKIKLKNIEESKKLLEIIDRIFVLSNHDFDNFKSDQSELNSLTKELLNETTEFIDSYTNVNFV